MPVKIAILLLNNFGDILYATPIAKQIKEYDYPDSHITWIVSKHCSDILNNNGFIDHLEIIGSEVMSQLYNGRIELIENAYRQKCKEGMYDKLFILQPQGANLINYKTCLRKLILDGYSKPIHVSLEPIVFLTREEKENVHRFIEDNSIRSFDNKILFEFSAKSGQSNVSPAEAIKIAEKIVEQNQSTCVILSSDKVPDSTSKKIFNAQALTFKENAELINNCTLILGCSSGLSWLSTSAYCKKIPTVQFLKTNVPWLNSLKNDFVINNLDSKHIIELYNFDNELIVEVINYFLKNGLPATKLKYDQEFKKKYSFNNFYQINKLFLKRKSYKNFLIFFYKSLHKGIAFIFFNLQALYSDIKKIALKR